MYKSVFVIGEFSRSNTIMRILYSDDKKLPYVKLNATLKAREATLLIGTMSFL